MTRALERPPPALEACILAGGLSARMGSDKGALRLGNKSMLARVRLAAKEAGLPVRVIRQDIVPRCGPLGGVYTGLRTTRAAAVLFLSCDMPFMTGTIVEKLLRRLRPNSLAVFAVDGDTFGFPFVVRREGLSVVEGLLATGRYSLQALAVALRASRFRPTKSEGPLMVNINTPAELVQARSHLPAS